MRYKPLFSIALGLGLATAGTALAEEPLTQPLGGDDAGKSGDRTSPSTRSSGDPTQGSQGLSFGGLDLNTDRKLSREEVRLNGSLSADFDKLDSNRDGSLSDAEFAKFEGEEPSAKDKAQRERDRAKNKAQDERDRTKDKAQDERDRARDDLE